MLVSVTTSIFLPNQDKKKMLLPIDTDWINKDGIKHRTAFVLSVMLLRFIENNKEPFFIEDVQKEFGFNYEAARRIIDELAKAELVIKGKRGRGAVTEKPLTPNLEKLKNVITEIEIMII